MFDGLIAKVNSYRLHTTPNTRRIAAAFSERHRGPEHYGLILSGFNSVVVQLEPVHAQPGGPIYQYCVMCVHDKRWRALPLTPKWTGVLGLSIREVRENATSFDRVQCDPKPYIIENVGALEVFSPNSDLLAIASGVGSGSVFNRNYEKDPDFRAAVDEIRGRFRRY